MIDFSDNPQGLIKNLESLAKAIERGETEPASISVHDILVDSIHGVDRILGEPDLDYIGDFITAAAAVIKAKAHKLLPPDEYEDDNVENTEESELFLSQDSDKEWSNEELLAHLMEYRIFQDAVEELARRDKAWRDVFPGSDSHKVSKEIPMAPNKMGIPDLLSALKDILMDAPREEFYYVPRDELNLERSINHIRSCIKGKGEAVFCELFFHPITRAGVIGVFLALLELIRLGEIIVHQDQQFGEIIVTFALEEQGNGI
ncbi:MAG: segregation/condensation protein A [Firmicutes bacterium]|nr:segregation/condensation protein A [Bacillota bacterium]